MFRLNSSFGLIIIDIEKTLIFWGIKNMEFWWQFLIAGGIFIMIILMVSTIVVKL